MADEKDAQEAGKEQEQPKEAPEEAAKAAAQVKKEEQAAGALMEAEDESGVEASAEQKETRIPIEDVRYVHIDDMPMVIDSTRDSLEKQLGMKNNLGDANSTPDAMKLLKSLAEKGERLDMIILDQEFFTHEVEPGKEMDFMADKRASKEFVKQFQALVQEEDAKDTLGDTKIIMYSGTANDEYTKEMQEISDRVVGLMQKGGKPEQTANGFAIMLADAGVVEETDKIAEARREETPKKFIAELENAGLAYGLKKPGSDKPQRLVDLVNEYREKLDLTPVAIDDSAFEKIVDAIDNNRDMPSYALTDIEGSNIFKE